MTLPLKIGIRRPYQIHTHSPLGMHNYINKWLPRGSTRHNADRT